MASDAKIPTSKMARTAITGLTTAKLGLKQIAYLSKTRLTQSSAQPSQKQLHEQEVGRILIQAFTQLRGTALKASQMLSMELGMLPSNIRTELAKACHSVTPLNRAHIRKVFLQNFQAEPHALFKSFNTTAFAAASLGQVHQAVSKEGETLAVKIQYPGIAACIQSDLQLIRRILKTVSSTTHWLPKWEIVDAALQQIEIGLYQEVDYCQEAANTQWFAKHLNLANIIVPSVIPALSREQVLTTHLLDGLHLTAWLATNPSQQQRNDFGQLLLDLFFYQLLSLKKLHADPHPGNFLFCQNGQLGVIDFGCVKTLDSDFPSIVLGLLSQDPKQLYSTYQQLGMIHSSLSYHAFTTEFFPAIQPFQCWLSQPFTASQFDFTTMPAMPRQDFTALKKTAKSFNHIRNDQPYFDRAFFGLISMLCSLGATVQTRTALEQYQMTTVEKRGVHDE